MDCPLVQYKMWKDKLSVYFNDQQSASLLFLDDNLDPIASLISVYLH